MSLEVTPISADKMKQFEMAPVQYKKADYEGIKRGAEDIVRYATQYDDRSNAALVRFVKKGKDAPGYADSVLSTAIADGSENVTKQLLEGKISLREANYLIMQINKKTNVQASHVLEEDQFQYIMNGPKIYPKTYRKRMLVNTHFPELSGEYKSVKKNKFIKKIVYSYYELHYKFNIAKHHFLRMIKV